MESNKDFERLLKRIENQFPEIKENENLYECIKGWIQEGYNFSQLCSVLSNYFYPSDPEIEQSKEGTPEMMEDPDDDISSSTSSDDSISPRRKGPSDPDPANPSPSIPSISLIEPTINPIIKEERKEESKEESKEPTDPFDFLKKYFPLIYDYKI